MDPWSERELWLWGWGYRQNDRENVRKALYLLLCVTSPLTLMPCWTCVESININCVPKVRSGRDWGCDLRRTNATRVEWRSDKGGTTIKRTNDEKGPPFWVRVQSYETARTEDGFVIRAIDLPINIIWRRSTGIVPFDENQFQKSWLCGRIAQDIGTVWTGTSSSGSHTPRGRVEVKSTCCSASGPLLEDVNINKYWGGRIAIGGSIAQPNWKVAPLANDYLEMADLIVIPLGKDCVIKGRTCLLVIKANYISRME